MSVNLVNGDTLNSDFTAICNAIRTKGGASSTISYTPGNTTDIVNAINNIPSGGTPITDAWIGTIAEYNALVSIDDTTLYTILYAGTLTRVYRQYLGHTLVYGVTDATYTDFYDEDITLNQQYLDTGIQILSSTNISRDWEIIYSKTVNTSGISKRDIVGNSKEDSTDERFYFYFNGGIYSQNFYFSDNANAGQTVGYWDDTREIKIRKENGYVTFYDLRNDSWLQEGQFAWNYSTASTMSLLLGGYNGTSRFIGTVNKFGFRWLS